MANARLNRRKTARGFESSAKGAMVEGDVRRNLQSKQRTRVLCCTCNWETLPAT